MSRLNNYRTMIAVPLFFLFLSTCNAWDQSELEIFDLVEEVNRNFYEVLDVPQNCTQAEIRRAYRRLSLQVHPDKNDAPDAEEKFRQLVGIYEILRDEGKRARYNQVLVDGLPDWRQPLYYYRRVRKMGSFELFTWLFVLFTVGQYAVAWASYFEKKLNEDEKQKKKQKKQKKKKTSEIDNQEDIEQPLAKPTYRNTLPFQLFYLIISTPHLCRSTVEWMKEMRRVQKEQKLKEKEEAEEMERLREELEKEKEREKERKSRRKRILPDLSTEPKECILEAVDEPTHTSENSIKAAPKSSGGPWTDDDMVDLAKNMKKYPVGTYERWEKIADAMNRTVFEITHFAKKVKENAYRPIDGIVTREEDEDGGADRVEKKKEKTRGGRALKGLESIRDVSEMTGTQGEELPSGSTGWSQKQQKALEVALAAYPKGSLERWERIAKAVPEKTKEDCMLRVKYLSEMVRKKKQLEEEQSQGEAKVDETCAASSEDQHQSE
nr:EOG090X0BHG [Sida crystallina]